MGQTAKLFKNGRSQAVRLPAAFRFDVDEVFIRRDAATGDVIHSAKPTTWDGFFEALKGVEIPDDFLNPADRSQEQSRPAPFEDWVGQGEKPLATRLNNVLKGHTHDGLALGSYRGKTLWTSASRPGARRQGTHRNRSADRGPCH